MAAVSAPDRPVEPVEMRIQNCQGMARKRCTTRGRLRLVRVAVAPALEVPFEALHDMQAFHHREDATEGNAEDSK